MSIIRIKGSIPNCAVMLPISVDVFNDAGDKIGTRQSFQSIAIYPDQTWDSDDPLIPAILKMTGTKMEDWFDLTGLDPVKPARRVARVETADRADLR